MDDPTDPSDPIKPTISVTGSGQVSYPPDLARIAIGISVLRGGVADATETGAALASSLIGTLRQTGVDERDLQTANYSVMADYDHRTQPRRLIGYRVDNTLQVTVRQLDSLPELLAEATAAGGDSVTINGISFANADPSALAVEARALAWADARATAEQLSELAGLTLGPARRIVEGGGQGGPVARPMMRAMVAEAAAVPIESGTVDETVTLAVEFEVS